MMPNQDMSIFVELCMEHATITTGRRCRNGMSIHQLWNIAEGTVAAVSDAALTSNYNLVRQQTIAAICYDVADVIVNPLQYFLFQELTLLVHANLITKGDLYHVRADEFQKPDPRTLRLQ